MKLIVLMGKAGSGKDSILQELVTNYSNAFSNIVSCTTRPPREGEQDGINYYFLTEEEFLRRVNNGDMLEYTNFNGWYYGSSISELSTDKVNIAIFNPAGIREIMDNPNIELYVYYVRASDKERLLRQLNRENHPDVNEIIRRFSADEEDFKSLEDIPYIELDNERQSDLLYNVVKIVSIFN